MINTVAISPCIVRRHQVLKMTGLSKSTLYRRIKTGAFPEPFRLGGPDSAAVGWKETDVMKWLDELEPRKLN